MHNESGLRSEGERRPVAAAPRVLHRIQQRKSVGLQQTRDLLFLQLARKWRDGGGEILCSKIFLSAALNRDPNGIHLRIQNVGAVRRGIHPSGVQRENFWSFSNIFGNQAKACSSCAQPCLQIGFAVEAMRERIVVGEKCGVQARGIGQREIPLQLAKAECGAFAIHCVVEHLFGGVGRTSRRSRRGK